MLLFLQYRDLQQLKVMGISDFISEKLDTICVYWGSPTNDGRGSFTFDDPIEIDCRWKEHIEIREDADGQEYVSKALVIVEQDVDRNGYLYLGDLDDINDSEEPIDTKDAFIIRGFEKIKALNTVEYLRKAYL